MIQRHRRPDSPPASSFGGGRGARRRATALLLLALVAPAIVGADDPPSRSSGSLPERYVEWLWEVAPLILPEERDAFLELRRDYHRDAFIERFWRERDPYPDTGRNELRERWDLRLAEVRGLFGDLADARSRIYLLNGPPAGRCRDVSSARELWYYPASARVGHRFNVLFVRLGRDEPYRVWEPGVGVLGGAGHPGRPGPGAARPCAGDLVDRFVRGVVEGPMAVDYVSSVRLAQSPPRPPSIEWVLTFQTYSTDLPAAAELFPASLAVEFPGRFQSRTVVQSLLAIDRDDVEAAALGDRRSYNFQLLGEVVREGKLFENFRYRFDLPARLLGGEPIPLAFQRYLRPGEYTLVLRVEDLNGGTFHRLERTLEVPRVEGEEPIVPLTAASERLLAEADAAVARGERSLEIVPPPGELLTGLVRFDVRVLGEDYGRLDFLLDDRRILSRLSPPYTVELDLGDLPRARRLRVEGYAEEGGLMASDELLVNGNSNRFSLRLVEPQPGRSYERSLRAHAEVQVPAGRVVDRVELYLGEEPAAVLYQPPFVQPLVLPEAGATSYVRAIAYLPDGNSTEDVVFVNAPDHREEIRVDMVELFATVLDGKGRPVAGLDRGDFRVLEDGARQEVLRFERVEDLPFHAAILLDSSASMHERMEEAKRAALGFLDQALQPKDRAAILPFHDQPYLAVGFTNDTDELAEGLIGVRPERGTALYDSVIYGLYFFNGVRGQRALLVLSDGKDEHSRFSFDEALEFARRSGVTIYAVGLDLSRGAATARRQLARLAEETGGRSYFVGEVAELDEIYAEIQRELRSRYLLAYQSTNTGESEAFRTVEVEVAGDLEAKTMRGYYP